MDTILHENIYIRKHTHGNIPHMNDLALTNIHDEHTNIDHGVYHLNARKSARARARACLGGYVYKHVSTNARVSGGMYLPTYVHQHVSTNMCLPIYQHMSINMCLPTCVYPSTNMCLSTCVYQHMSTNMCLPTCGYQRARVRGDMFTNTCVRGI